VASFFVHRMDLVVNHTSDEVHHFPFSPLPWETDGELCGLFGRDHIRYSTNGSNNPSPPRTILCAIGTYGAPRDTSTVNVSRPTTGSPSFKVCRAPAHRTNNADPSLLPRIFHRTLCICNAKNTQVQHGNSIQGRRNTISTCMSESNLI
jgi:hypothetical protein